MNDNNEYDMSILDELFGSVVTKGIPANVVAGGNPRKVIRPIKESEKKWSKFSFLLNSP